MVMLNMDKMMAEFEENCKRQAAIPPEQRAKQIVKNRMEKGDGDITDLMLLTAWGSGGEVDHHVIAMCMDRGAKIHAINMGSSTVLGFIISRKMPADLALKALQHGHDPNWVRAPNGCNAQVPIIFDAIQHDRVDILELLIQFGADVNKKTTYCGHHARDDNFYNFESPLNMAASKGHVEMAAMLIAAGADLESPDGRLAKTRAANIETQKLFTCDPVCGLLVKSDVQNVMIRRMMRQEQRAESGIIKIDLRNFKRLNDLHGHEAGNAALQRFADFLAKLGKKCKGRSGGIVTPFRTGGDEFELLLVDVDLNTCEQAVDKIVGYHHVCQTVSISARAVCSIARGAALPRKALKHMEVMEADLHALDHPNKLDRTMLGFPDVPDRNGKKAQQKPFATCIYTNGPEQENKGQPPDQDAANDAEREALMKRLAELDMKKSAGYR